MTRGLTEGYEEGCAEGRTEHERLDSWDWFWDAWALRESVFWWIKYLELLENGLTREQKIAQARATLESWQLDRNS